VTPSVAGVKNFLANAGYGERVLNLAALLKIAQATV